MRKFQMFIKIFLIYFVLAFAMISAQESPKQYSELHLVNVGAKNFYLQIFEIPFNGAAVPIPLDEKEQKDIRTAFEALVIRYKKSNTIVDPTGSSVMQRMLWPNTRTFVLWDHPSSRKIENVSGMLRFYFSGEKSYLPLEKSLVENLPVSLPKEQLDFIRSEKSFEVGNFFVKDNRVSKALLSAVYFNMKKDPRFIGSTMMAETKIAQLGDHKKFSEFLASKKGSPHEYLYNKFFGLEREMSYEDVRFSGNYSSWMLGSAERAMELFEVNFGLQKLPAVNYSTQLCKNSATASK